MRNGYWVILDELNLAPSEILEALNRLLDDNREIYIPEIRETIKAHNDFHLFATQNPSSSIYGGRKELSLAFQNRFILYYFDMVNDDEMTEILMKSSSIPLSYCQIMMKIMKELRQIRTSTNVFAASFSFITPRDLFRWAKRQPNGKIQLAEHGYMLLAERIRNPNHCQIIQSVIEKHCKIKLDINKMYNLNQIQTNINIDGHNIAWTKSLLRMYRLINECIINKEPILLVGETGTGKTTICQIFSNILNRSLNIINIHQNTETSDFIGGLRPIRNKSKIEERLRELLQINNQDNLLQSIELYQQVKKQIKEEGDDQQIYSNEHQNEINNLISQYTSLFEWQDGPLISSMKLGHIILLDEISLGQDAVLERLNSVLEPSRTILLAEKSGKQIESIQAHNNFILLATMNPGGDYGKKELSPALRNRFTEIYVPSTYNRLDLYHIVYKAMNFNNKIEKERLCNLMIDFYLYSIDILKQYNNIKNIMIKVL